MSRRTSIKPPGKCIYCGSGNLTHEHIFADWLSKQIDTDQKVYGELKTIRGNTSFDTYTEKTRQGNPIGRSIRCVCATCNNTWLSRLQEVAKPYLLSLIAGQNQDLDRNAQQAVANFASMVSMVGEFTAKDLIAIPQSERNFLRESKKPPANWIIAVGRYIRGGWNGRYLHHTIPVIVPGKEHLSESYDNGMPRPNTQTTTLAIGQLYIHAISSIHNEILHYGRIEGEIGNLLAQIWPIKSDTVSFPPKITLNDADADSIARTLYRQLTAKPSDT